MKGCSIIIPVFNQIEVTKRCLDYIYTTEEAELDIIIIDNASTDGTKEFFTNLDTHNLTYIRNRENAGLVKSFNQGASIAKYELLCFMHNDSCILDHQWLKKIYDFFMKVPSAGLVGFYGAQRIKKDGSFMHRSKIAYDKASGYYKKRQYCRVAALDGLCIIMKRSFFTKVGGFDENFIMYYYDKDISLKSISAGYHNYILLIPFLHKGAITRKSPDFIKDIGSETVLVERMKQIFLGKWANFIPYDTRTFTEKVSTWTNHKLRQLSHKLRPKI